MKAFVYMMLVASVIGTDMPAVGQMKADGTMAEGRGEGPPKDELPPGMYPCKDLQCGSKDFQCSTIRIKIQMPSFEEMMKMQGMDMSTMTMDQTDAMMIEYLNQKEMMEKNPPPVPPMCVESNRCTTPYERGNFQGMDFEIDCWDGGKSAVADEARAAYPDPDGERRDRDGGDSDYGDLPPGMYPCKDLQCGDKSFQCSTIMMNFTMPSFDQMMEKQGMDMSTMTAEQMDAMQKEYQNQMEMMQKYPPQGPPPLCVEQSRCGSSDNFKGMDFEIDCDDGGRSAGPSDEGGDRDGGRRDRGDSDDDYGGSQNYIDIGDNGVRMSMNQDGMGASFEMGRDGTFGSAEMGPMKMEMEMERDDMNMSLDDGNGGRIQVEAGEDGVRLVMLNAKALLASATTAAAVTMTLF